MRIKDARALPEGAPLKVVNGPWAGLEGTHFQTRQYEGLVRTGLIYTYDQIRTYYKQAGREDLVATVPHVIHAAGGALVWLRPAEVELRTEGKSCDSKA